MLRHVPANLIMLGALQWIRKLLHLFILFLLLISEWLLCFEGHLILQRVEHDVFYERESEVA